MTALPDLPLPPELAVDDEPLTDDDLDRYFAVMDAGPDDGSANPEVESAAEVHAWRIEDDGAAEWAFRKLAAARAEHETLRLQAEDWAARIDHWFSRSAAPLARRVAYFTNQLEGYALRLREGGVKTRPLVSGTVNTTGSDKPVVELADEEAVVAWALATLEGEQLAKVVKVETSVRISELRKLVEVVDGDVVLTGTNTVVSGVATAPGKIHPHAVPSG